MHPGRQREREGKFFQCNIIPVIFRKKWVERPLPKESEIIDEDPKENALDLEVITSFHEIP